jgi:hypothetical protein
VSPVGVAAMVRNTWSRSVFAMLATAKAASSEGPETLSPVHLDNRAALSCRNPFGARGIQIPLMIFNNALQVGNQPNDAGEAMAPDFKRRSSASARPVSCDLPAADTHHLHAAAICHFRAKKFVTI